MGRGDNIVHVSENSQLHVREDDVCHRVSNVGDDQKCMIYSNVSMKDSNDKSTGDLKYKTLSITYDSSGYYCLIFFYDLHERGINRGRYKTGGKVE